MISGGSSSPVLWMAHRSRRRRGCGGSSGGWSGLGGSGGALLDDGEHLPAGHDRSALNPDLLDDAVGRSGDLENHFVRLEIGQVLVTLDGVARLFVPGDERRVRDGLRQLGNPDFSRHELFLNGVAEPPASVAAAIAALDVIEADPVFAASAVEKARLFTRALNMALAQSPIVPLVLSEETVALEAQQILEKAGFLVTAIRPPTVPAGTARLRFAFTAGHPDEEIARLAQVVRERVMVLAP